MRVTEQIIYSAIADSLQKNLQRLLYLNEQLATGKRINKPSDSPVDLTKALHYRVEIQSIEQLQRNSDEAQAYLNATEGVLSSVSEVLIRLKELALTGVNGDESEESRAAIAKEVQQLKKELLALANTKFRERYIFSGYRTDTEAFDPLTLSYQGDDGIINVLVDKGVLIATNLTGEEVFSYTLSSEEVVQLQDGRYIHYIPGGGTTVNVEIRDVDDTTVLDSFSFSNMLQMSQILADALEADDVTRARALLRPLDLSIEKVSQNIAEIGARLNLVEEVNNRNGDEKVDLRILLSGIEDADIVSLVTEISKTEAALQALRSSSMQLMNISLFDFIR